MKKLLPAMVTLFLIAFAGPPALAAFEDMEKVFDAFYQTDLDVTRAVGVENLTIRKDAMTFRLKKGLLLPMKPLEGEVTGAMFVGEGTASLPAPTPMDAWYLETYGGGEPFSIHFTELYMRFTDGTEKLFPKEQPGVAREAVASKIESVTKSFDDRQNATDDWVAFGASGRFDLDIDFIDTRVGGIRGRDYFYAQFLTAKDGWLTFHYHPGEIHELLLGHERQIGAQTQFLALADFHKQADYKESRYFIHPDADTHDLIDVKRYDIDISIPTTKTVELDAKITLEALVDSLSSLHFELWNQFGDLSWRHTGRPIVVESVTDPDGNSLPFIHKRNQLLIRLPQPIARGKDYAVQVKIREDTIVQVTAESYLLYNTYPWFPWYGYVGGRYAFDFQIEVKRPLKPIGSGHIVREWEDEETKMNGIELRMDEPVQIPSFLFGRFLREEEDFASSVSKRDIHLTVNAFPRMTSTITDPRILALIGTSTPYTYTLNVPPGKMKGILEESKGIIEFLEQLYGPFPYGDLQIAQMYPYSGFGQAPPSLVQLDGRAFQSQAELQSDFIHGFLSHEIAHQYWGHCIAAANDREVWLHESFAEYSAGMYVQAYSGETRFQQKMDDWRKNAKEADAFAPIAMATVLSGDNSGTYYQDLVYNKGPLVAHMIRTQIGNENYVKAMTNLMKEHQNRNITTDMMAIELAKVTGYSWGYFFDQWFRDIGIPEIHYNYKVTPQGDKYLFEMTVSQADEDHFKKLFLPVRWQGKSKEQDATKAFPIGQQDQVIKALIPFEPTEVEVDPDRSLLAEIVWDK